MSQSKHRKTGTPRVDQAEGPAAGRNGTPKPSGGGIAPGQLAELLTRASGRDITADMLQTAIDAGAPTRADGTFNLIDLMAWLEREIAR